MIQLYPHQQQALDLTAKFNRVAYYYDMGLGKTYIGSEKLMSFESMVGLVICQKSKIDDWIEHFTDNYATHDRDYCEKNLIFNLTKKPQLERFLYEAAEATEQHWIVDEETGQSYVQENLYPFMVIGVINYELAFRRPELLKLRDYTLMLDESSLIQNEQAKRSKFILRMHPQNVVLLSGTPTAGKYEQLWSQCQLLGWKISKTAFWNSYVRYHLEDYNMGFPVKIIDGYKNVDDLKNQLAAHGAIFMKTEDVLDLPQQVEQKVYLKVTPQYNRFSKERYLLLKDGTELVGDNTLTKIMYLRQLCGQYHSEKLNAFRDLVQSTEDRLIVFYNFTAELEQLQKIATECRRHISVVNGQIRDLTHYEQYEDSITFVQYQAGAMGLNLQKANKIIYFTLPLGKGSCDLWEQSKKRIHRIGQDRTCFYYYLLVRGSIEMWNLKALQEGRELTNELFE